MAGEISKKFWFSPFSITSSGNNACSAYFSHVRGGPKIRNTMEGEVLAQRYVLSVLFKIENVKQ